jgi:hypothetical protein
VDPVPDPLLLRNLVVHSPEYYVFAQILPHRLSADNMIYCPAVLSVVACQYTIEQSFPSHAVNTESNNQYV